MSDIKDEYVQEDTQFETVETHPSYATIAFNRRQGGKTNLFGSSIQHEDTISCVIRNAEIDRHLNTDWIRGTRELIEVEMSYSQFAEAITSMNQGTGIPCTLRRFNGKHMPDCKFVNKKDQFSNELLDRVQSANKETHDLIHSLQKLFTEKKTLNKADKEEIIRTLTRIEANTGHNIKFTYDCFNEQMDKTITEAKGEIEAFMQNKLLTLANMALVENGNLETLIAETHAPSIEDTSNNE